MRKTLMALLGLVAVGLWAVPALAVGTISDPPKAYAPIPLEDRAGRIGEMARNGNNYQATLSGTLVKQASATTTWFLYPGACIDRGNNTWVAKTSIQADSLNTYAAGSQGGYSRTDLSLADPLWHIVDAATDPGERPTIPAGSRAIWCGKYDANWVVPVGYPNITNQILYIDLEANRPHSSAAASTGTYSISMLVNASTEQNYDFIYFIGGGDDDHNGFGDEDPLGNDRGAFDQVRATGSFGDAHLTATFTGSLQVGTPGLVPFVNGSLSPTIIGSGASGPQQITLNYQMSTSNRAFYILFTADCLFSSEDGLWPFGNGVIFDNITVSDNLGLPGSTNRVVYDEGTTAGGFDPVGGNILSAATAGFDTDGVMIAARVFPGKGELWAIAEGNLYGTADICQPQKNLSSDKFFLGVDPVSKNALPGQYNAIVSCTFPVPDGTADITAVWGSYLNLPRTSGYVQQTEYRYFKDGSWSNWEDSSQGVVTSVVDQWVLQGDPLAAAVQADSVQVRWIVQCITAFAADRTNCDNNTQYAVLYDDLFLQVTTGVPAPVFDVFVGAVAQTTFVDGTMTGLNCSSVPCWPGIRGSALAANPNPDIAASAVLDNFNSPYGDSITMQFRTGLRKNGMGINWKQGYDKTVNGGETIAHSNPNFNATYGPPMVIYRLYDPQSNSWSPWDSTACDADGISVAADTVIINSEYRINWPPRDKIGQNLPGGFTINGVGAYSNLAFLPRGTRVQYYFKAVDINGGTAYQFQTNTSGKEVVDLPTLPGGTVAPDIVEFNVLPRKYPAGTAGTLLAGRTSAQILDLDGVGTSWSFTQNPVVAALRGMGVRADRYRFLQGLNSGGNFGGHELAGDRPSRLSNYFPNKDEYGIVDSLASWYRIMIQNSHTRTVTVLDEMDAAVVSDWAKKDTGANGGDRCIFFSGDDAFNALTNQPVGVPGARQQAVALDIFGVANVVTLAPSAAKGSWAGAGSVPYPVIDDRFAAPGSGPGLAAPGSFTYEADAGCPGPNRFDPLTAQSVGATAAVASATYPLAAGVTDVAGVANTGEWDVTPDLDKTKSLAYGYSIQYVRGVPGAIPRNAANYVRSGVQNRMQILYKFLTGCRGARAAGSTCWPCPTDANMLGNWAVLAGFNTGTYGPLYAIQDFTTATGVEVEEASAAPRVNRLEGNAPNPFNPLTKISFTAAQAGKVTIKIYNVAGQLVRTLETKVEKAGPSFVHWDGKSNRGSVSPSGVYFTKATFADGTTLAGKTGMTLLK